MRQRINATAGRRRLAIVIGTAVLGVAACGGSGGSPDADSIGTAGAAVTIPAASATPASAEPGRCRRVPLTTLRLIASHANVRTRFNARSAAAVSAGSGYAVSVVAAAGGSRRVGTWFVDDLRAPQTVTSGNPQALQITNWPLESLATDVAGQSRNCATQNLRRVGPVP